MPLASLEPLRHRNFALVWWAGLVSNAGSWMQTVAVGAFVTSRTGRAGWAGLAAAAAFLPIGLLAPIGGALADRIDRRRFIMVANLGEAGMASVLVWLVVSGRATPASVTAVVFVAGCMGAVRLPFYQAMTPDLVPREQLLAAASLGSAQYNLGRVVGPTLAGAVIAVWGYQWAFAVNAVSFFAVILAMALVRIEHVRSTDTTGLLERIRVGVRAARANPGARSAIVLIGCVAFLLAPFIALISARAFDLAGGEARRLTDPDGVQEATAAITGYLTTAQGAGAVLGALLLAPLAMRVGRRRLLLANVTLTPIALAAYAYAPTTPMAVAALALAGMLYIGILSGANNVVQLWAPAEFRGRILSLYLVALGSVYPIGGLIQGSIADRIGLPLTTTIFAAIMFAVLVFWRLRRPGFLAPLTDPDELAPSGGIAPVVPRSVR
ncbi:MAG TPA: MFS transporter [Acidimicrobiales bacterium]|nr:MFS transporter [Acidimicrobiales bacterium]